MTTASRISLSFVLGALALAACSVSTNPVGSSAASALSEDGGADAAVDAGNDSATVAPDAAALCPSFGDLEGAQAGSSSQGVQGNQVQLATVSFFGANTSVTITLPEVAPTAKVHVTLPNPSGAVVVTAGGARDPSDFLSSNVSFAATAGTVDCGPNGATLYRCTLTNVHFAGEGDGTDCAGDIASLVLDVALLQP